MDEKKNCEVLFEYLRSILYDPVIQEPDLSTLDEPYQKLGQGLQVLQGSVEEMQGYSEDLSRGMLSGEVPSRDNFLCKNLKNLHANLNHLTWQAQQVAAGDYSQHVSYLGEFSDAFNTMTAQLRERETLLKNEAEKEKKRVQTMTQYTDFLVELTHKRNELILVIDIKTKEVLYSNQSEERDFRKNRQERDHRTQDVFCVLSEKVLRYIRCWKSGECEKISEIEDVNGHFYEINSAPIEWQGIPASAHIITDITGLRQEASKLTSMAYHDTLTGIKNRIFFDKEIRNILNANIPLSFCYIDIDHLKFVNDRYGHLEGDAYLRNFTRVVNENIREDDTFIRIGGDEFCLIVPGCRREDVIARMDEILYCFRHFGNKPYPMGFSYGIVELSECEDTQRRELRIEEILKQSDALMYERKREHKKYL